MEELKEFIKQHIKTYKYELYNCSSQYAKGEITEKGHKRKYMYLNGRLDSMIKVMEFISNKE